MDQMLPPSTGAKLAASAENFLITYAGARYASPPVSDQAFDCSYFVWLVIRTVNPHFEREASGAIAADRLRFQPVLGAPEAGDIVYFPPGPVPYEVKKGHKRNYPGHVAIMVSASEFIGMQSSGVGRVHVPDTWWWPRTKEFYRYIGPMQ
ncbi:hypothetical protein UAJ10_04500 [Nitrospirillum sp. BR 11164]|uniref:NlpC/P60 family protein n=1 Tax=Nitrospirillum sp. BR 11164 TaxID=3104324 RepID=UPI002AFEE771|nr:NlpC/P60 family protein [Nitrospirillum sp. BR 11164]MEA1648275.1 hypothetical protein [Nitrospirillum sp. BR 11164]